MSTSIITNDDPCLTISDTSSSALIIHCNTATEQQATTEGAGSIPYNDATATTTTSQQQQQQQQPAFLTASTTTPSPQPSSTSFITTLRPTRNQIPFVLSGTLYYDLNANSQREANIPALFGDRSHLGDDVEYSVGLGGVTVQLVECHGANGDDENGGDESAIDIALNNNNSKEEEETQVVTAVTIGVNVQGRPNLVLSGGDYNLVDIKVDRSYYINVKAPTGYLLTGGVCSDDDELVLLGGGGGQTKWACSDGVGIVGTKNSGIAAAIAVVGEEWILLPHQPTQQQLEEEEGVVVWQHNETNLGIPEGRSSKCVSVDKAGLTDSTLDIGVMRLGDVQTFVVGYHVSFDREEDDTMMTTTTIIATAIDDMRLQKKKKKEENNNLDDDEDTPPPPSSSPPPLLLLPEDLDAVRNVITEIFAVNFQKALMQRDLSFVQIDEVLSLDVQYHIIRNATAVPDDANLFGDTESDAAAITTTATDNNEGGTTRNIFQKTQNSGKDDKEDFFSTYSLSVDLIVKGHYRKDMDVNIHDGMNTTTIEKLLQNVTSGNTTQDELLQDLLDYNPLCLEQMTKMKEPAFTLDDYSEVHSSKGILQLSSPSRDAVDGTGSNVFSAACANGNVLGFLLMNKQTAEEEEVEAAAVANTTRVKEGQGALDKVATSSVEDLGPPWLPIVIGLVCAFVVLSLVIFLVRRRRRQRAKEGDQCAMDDTSHAPSECKSPSIDGRDKGDPMGTLLGLIYKNKKRVASKNTEFHDIEAGLESGGELLDDDKPSTTSDVSDLAMVEENDKEPLRQEEKHSGDDEDKIMDQHDDEEAVKADTGRIEEGDADASNLEAQGTSLNLDGSDKKSRRRRRPNRKKSNSDFANEPSQSNQHDTLRRSVCDLDIGTKRMKDSRELSNLILGETTADREIDDKKKSGHRSRYATIDNLQSKGDKRYERVKEIHQTEAYFAAESSRRRGRKHDPLRQSVDDSNIGLRSRGIISTLNDAPKVTRRKGRKPNSLRQSVDDSNIGLRTAGAAAALNEAPKEIRRKSRKPDPPQDDSNIGLRTAGAAAAANTTLNEAPKEKRRKSRKPDPPQNGSNIDRPASGAATANTTLTDAPKATRRKKSRKHDPLRMSQDDSNIGLRTAGAAAAKKDAKKMSRKKSRKHDPLRMSQDDSNVGLQTARKKASKSDSDTKRKKGRRQDPLRLSRCDLDIGTKRQPENIMVLKDQSSKSERHKHDRGMKDETEKRPSVKRSFSK